MSKSPKPKRIGRPPVETKFATTSISLHPYALIRLAALAREKHMSRSALIVAALRASFPSAFDGL
jgi:hypothetical protein